MFLHRIASTVRWSNVEEIYDLFSSQLSEIFWEMVQRVVDKFKHALQLRGSFSRQRAQQYAEAIRDVGAPLDRCVGSIDCTKIRMQRPGAEHENQQSVYSGHKRMHCLIYQNLTTPDGLMFALYGPEVGRRHDLTLLRNSNWNEILHNSLLIEGNWYYIYGHAAYLMRPWMLRPYIYGLVTPLQRMFNRKMSGLSVSVEHNYKDLKQYWTSQDFSRKLKARKVPISLLYKASALMLNFRVCLYQGGQIQIHYNIRAPTLD